MNSEKFKIELQKSYLLSIQLIKELDIEFASKLEFTSDERKLIEEKLEVINQSTIRSMTDDDFKNCGYFRMHFHRLYSTFIKKNKTNHDSTLRQKVKTFMRYSYFENAIFSRKEEKLVEIKDFETENIIQNVEIIINKLNLTDDFKSKYQQYKKFNSTKYNFLH